MSSSPFNSYNVLWKIGEQVFADSATDHRYRTQDLVQASHPLPGDVGSGTFTSLKLTSGLSVHHSAFEFNAARSSQPLSAVVHMDLKEPCLLMHFVLVGGLTRHDYIKGRRHRLAPGTALLQWTERTHSELAFDQLPAVEVLYVHASRSSLNLLLGSELTEHLQYSVQTSNSLMALPTKVSAPLRFCFDETLTGPVRKLHAQNKLLEFLEQLIRYFDEIGMQRPINQRFSAYALMHYLKQRPGQLPPAGELAQRFGVSVGTMNEAFIAAFGMSVASFMKEQRMTYAHEFLSNTRLSVAEIAAQLGYSHVSNFSAAFRAFFGYSPTELRRSALSDER